MSNRLKMRNPWLYFQSKGFLQKTQAGVTANKKDFGTPTLAANGMALANVTDKSAALDSIPGLDIIVEAFAANDTGFHATKSQAESTKQRRLSDKEKFPLADPRKKADGATTADSATISKGDRIKIREDIIKIDSGKVEVNDKTGDTNKGLTIGDTDVLTIIERKRAAAHGTNHVKGSDLLVPAYSFLGADAIVFNSGNGIDPDIEPSSTASASAQRAGRRIDQTNLHFKAQSGNNATDVVTLLHNEGAFPDICKGMEIACNSHEYNKKIVMHTLDFEGNQTLLDYWASKGVNIIGCIITLDAHAL
tara:strand:- start:422 stop:1339 length:918 start_codon:yes stop_codon:yes gene_type:complete